MRMDMVDIVGSGAAVCPLGRPWPGWKVGNGLGLAIEKPTNGSSWAFVFQIFKSARCFQAGQSGLFTGRWINAMLLEQVTDGVARLSALA